MEDKVSLSNYIDKTLVIVEVLYEGMTREALLEQLVKEVK